VIYLCTNFSLPRPPCSRVRPDVRDRQTDVRQTRQTDRRSDVRQMHRLMPPPYWGGGIINNIVVKFSLSLILILKIIHPNSLTLLEINNSYYEFPIKADGSRRPFRSSCRIAWDLPKSTIPNVLE